MATVSRRKKNDHRSFFGFFFFAAVIVVLVLVLSFAWLKLLQKIAAGRIPDSLVSMNATISASVRGNLGPPDVMLRDGDDWLKDRWQAASDMHGTAIKGPHWVHLKFSSPVAVNKIVLDWEAAYSDDYRLVATTLRNESRTIFDSKRAVPGSHLSTHSWGQSPGVKTKTPLHVEHSLMLSSSTLLRELRLEIRNSAMGWGISLWKIAVIGHEVPEGTYSFLRMNSVSLLGR